MTESAVDATSLDNDKTVEYMDSLPSLSLIYSRLLQQNISPIVSTIVPDKLAHTLSHSAGKAVQSVTKNLSKIAKKSKKNKISLIAAPKVSDPKDITTIKINKITVDHKVNANFKKFLEDVNVSDVCPGYLHVLGFRVVLYLMTLESFAVKPAGLLHTDNTVEQFRAVSVDEPLDIVVSFTQPIDSQRGKIVNFNIKISSHDTNELVFEEQSTYLSKIPRSVQEKAHQSQTQVSDSSTHNPRAVLPDSLPVLTALWDITSKDNLNYAHLSKDYNPIHLSKILSHIFGTHDKIAHGMYLAIRSLAQVGAIRSQSFRWDISFYKPVPVPGRVALNLTDDFDVEAWTQNNRSHQTWKSTEITAWNMDTERICFKSMVTKI